MNRYEFLIRFSIVTHKKPSKIRQYLQQIPDDADHSVLLRYLNFSAQQTALFYQYDLNKVLEWIAIDQHFLISYTDPDYPELLRQISSPPLLLFGIGNKALLSTPQIAMVGSRIFSEYGAQWGHYFASELAINGLTITSGLALGIDAICHRGAIEVKGHTVAVLGSGAGNITPKTNYYLAQNILAEGGAIVSEFLPNEMAKPPHFPRRNRIISGLSLGTFVIEASEKSGSLITARYALEQNRDVFALPGDINSENCQGTHWLIKQGAYLVSQPTDILEHYVNYANYANNLIWEKQLAATPQQDDTSTIHPDVFSVIHNHPITIDLIADKMSEPITEITIKLIELELEGLIKQVSGGYIRHKYR